MTALLNTIWTYLLEFVNYAAVFAEHFHKLVYPVLLAALALFYFALKKQSANAGNLKAVAQDPKYRKKLYKINRQVILLLLFHFLIINPFRHFLSREMCTIIKTTLDTLLLIPLLSYFFMLPDGKAATKDNSL